MTHKDTDASPEDGEEERPPILKHAATKRGTVVVGGRVTRPLGRVSRAAVTVSGR
jgi:hypothetical protein